MKVVYTGPRESFSHYDPEGKKCYEFKQGEPVEVESKFGSALVARADFDVHEGKGKTEAGSEPKK